MNRLKELRIEKGLFQSDIAKILNISDRAVGFYETEKRDMSTETLAKLADFFDVSIDYLLCKTDIRKYNEIEKEFRYAYHRDIKESGLTEEEIKDAIRLYKEIKYGKNNEN